MLVLGVAPGILRDRPIVVSGGHDGSVLVWDIRDDVLSTVFEPLEIRVRDVGLVRVNGRERVVAGGDTAVMLGDPDTGIWEKPLTAPGSDITCMDIGTVEGRPIAVTGTEQGTVCVWELDGRPVAVTAGRDATVRVWDLTRTVAPQTPH
jgi:WD40 repeat protein